MKNTQTNVGSFAAAKLQAKRRGLLAIIALVAAIGFSFAACDAGGAPRSVTYTGNDGDNEYNLVITEAAAKAAYAPTSGDTYKLTISKNGIVLETSTGTVLTVTGVTIRLQPNGGGVFFEVTVSSTGDIVSLPTSIPVDGGGAPHTTGAVTSGSLTITGLSAYNGKYVIAFSFLEGGGFNKIAAATVTNNVTTMTAKAISGGSAKLNVWEVTDGSKLGNYNGSDTGVSFGVIIINKATLTESDMTALSGNSPPPWVLDLDYTDVSFTSGVGTVVFESSHK